MEIRWARARSCNSRWCGSRVLREREAVFWVFVFPVLLAAGLGIAFRNRGRKC